MVKLLDKVCCMSLRTAGLVIGWLNEVGCAIAFIVFAYVIGYSDTVADYLLRMWHIPINQKSHAEVNSSVVLFVSIYIVAVLISAVLSGLLIWGIKKNRPSMILPWVIVNGIGIVGKILNLFGAIYGLLAGATGGIERFFLSLLAFVIYFYAFWGIFSLYKHMQIHKITGHSL
ncbi:uncharacterized protein LOC117570780 [Drosophila albomicans]|uniref:Uncharacterized protein LOC117570780 n=1 Tax=Drosophila albomicans TaxID=7291 RepID=A0A6P8YR75_DROAB|nr:uncharacterized protein LOC117570780 [Drosophila albomicans]